jgi:hypothetical protein
VLGAGGWAYGNRQTRIRWDARFQDSFDAYGRAAEYVDSGVLLFEPRYLDLEKSSDALRATPQPHYGPADASRRENMLISLWACDLALDNYRQWFNLFQKADEDRSYKVMQAALDGERTEMVAIINCRYYAEPQPQR